ncbi:MAG: hypothetical protein FJ313_04070, partial [Gemmatimonadetes bacterium]|nr:hypothetical protein [Gemmatimonadota bacterium]
MDSRLRSLGILGRLHSVRMPITRGGDNPAAVVRVAGSLAMPACAAALLAAAFLVAAPFAAAGMLDAYVGCSWTDNCYPFDLQTYEIGEAIDVLPEGNYPYDA